MKTYESCFDYKLDAEDVATMYDGKDWDTEFISIKQIYDPSLDFMKQLSQHNLFLLVCMLNLNNDDYMEKCCQIESEMNYKTKL